LWSFWEARRNGRRYPGRGDFTPFDFFDLGVIGSIVLIDVHRDPVRLRFRLVGTKVVERFRTDPTGCWLDELSQKGLGSFILDRSLQMVESGVPVCETQVFARDNRAPRQSEVLRLPLARDGETIDMVLTCALYMDWLPAEKAAAEAC
jgi:hypothetical protein